MKLLRGLHNPGLEDSGCVATIGNFDGVHRGHQVILERLVNRAQEKGVPAVVVVFEPQPLEYFKGLDAPPRLMTLREKLQALSGLGVDYVFCLRFSAALSQYSADQFVDEVLLKHLGVKHLVIGDDFRYGGDREGDFQHLQRRGVESGFGVESTATCTDERESVRISSTRIRDALASGDFSQAAAMLGRPFMMGGRVVHGQALGRTLGFPTANIPLRRLRAPVNGVFAVRMHRQDGPVYDGVANVGKKPSVGQFQPNLEVHVFDFDEALYGERVEVEFVAHLRDEQRFADLDALKDQIRKDAQQARQLLQQLNQHNGQAIAK